MSNFSMVEDTPAHKYEVEALDDTISASITPHIHIKSWHIDVLIVIVGLLALFFFIALGGMFALLGPWVIYIGVLSMRKRPGPGKQLLRIIAAAGLLSLSVAALLAPDARESWRIAGSVLGLLAGSNYLVVTFFSMRKTFR